MKEVEQNPIRESSKLTQRRVWNRAKETKAYKTSLEDEVQAKILSSYDSLEAESNSDRREQNSSRKRNQKKLNSTREEFRRKYYTKHSVEYKKVKSEKYSIRKILESLLALTEEEDSSLNTKERSGITEFQIAPKLLHWLNYRKLWF